MINDVSNDIVALIFVLITWEGLLSKSQANNVFIHEHAPLGNSTVERLLVGHRLRTMCGSRTSGWSLPCVMSD
jgi:hypothetical protein